jgi:DNA-directed RNA polymerase specialized sigma24 family protein
MAGEGSGSQVSGDAGLSSDLSMSIPEGLKWPSRLKEFSKELLNPRDEHSREEARGKVWKILNGAICLYIRLHASRLGRITREDREDMAADKSLHLLHRIESGGIDFSDRLPSEIAGFISRTVRNELLDFLRKEGRRVELIKEDRPEWDVCNTENGKTMSATVAPDVLVQRREFAEALRRCVELLDPRAALCWFFRVFYEMASRDIAVHPKIRLNAGHVDVLLQRSRKMIRDCVRRSGFDPHEMPPGTFIELWKTFRLKGVSE